MGRKLRVMTVEKRFIKGDQSCSSNDRRGRRMSGTFPTLRAHLYPQLYQSFSFIWTIWKIELTTMALQMLVKDLLILFQAGNEGVINVSW